MRPRLRLTLHFNIRSKKDEVTNIYAIINCNGKQTKIPTGLYVRPSHWDAKRETCKILDKYTKLENENNSRNFNIIFEIKLLFHKLYLYFCNEPNVWDNDLDIINKIKKEVFEIMTKNNVNIKKIVMENNETTMKKDFDCIVVLTDKLEADTRIKEATKRQYRAAIRTLGEYLNDGGIKVCGFSDFNRDFLTGYYRFALSCTTHGQVVKTKTANDKLKNLVHLLNIYGEGFELSSSDVARLKNEKITINEHPDEIALLDYEVLRLLEYQCANEQEEIVRDLFVLNCLCGQRISDVKQLIDNYRIVNGRGYTSCVQNKTNELVDIKILFEAANQILAKYHGQDIKIPHTNIFNRLIKEVARKAGITGKCKTNEQRGETRTVVQTERDRYSMLTSHSGRRTFITCLSLRGWGVREIQEYSGHRKDDMVQLYAKTTPAMRDQFANLPSSQRLKMVGEQAETSTDTMSVDECKDLLYFIGVPQDDFVDLNTIDEVSRVFWKNEGRLLDCGISAKAVKEIWHSQGKTLKERKQALQMLLNEYKGKVKSA